MQIIYEQTCTELDLNNTSLYASTFHFLQSLMKKVKCGCPGTFKSRSIFKNSKRNISKSTNHNPKSHYSQSCKLFNPEPYFSLFKAKIDANYITEQRNCKISTQHTKLMYQAPCFHREKYISRHIYSKISLIHFQIRRLRVIANPITFIFRKAHSPHVFLVPTSLPQRINLW